jgi:hypothetical protein
VAAGETRGRAGIRSGYASRVLLLDLADSAAPIAEVSSVRTVGGAELKLVALGIVNDVTLFRDLQTAFGASVEGVFRGKSPPVLPRSRA